MLTAGLSEFRPPETQKPGRGGRAKCPPGTTVVIARQLNFRHRLGEGIAVRSKTVLGGLHHEYFLVPAVA